MWLVSETRVTLLTDGRCDAACVRNDPCLVDKDVLKMWTICRGSIYQPRRNAKITENFAVSGTAALWRRDTESAGCALPFFMEFTAGGVAGCALLLFCPTRCSLEKESGVVGRSCCVRIWGNEGDGARGWAAF